MKPNSLKGSSTILFMTVMDLVTYVARDWPLKDFQILVASQDIIASDMSSNRNANSVKNISVYDNIDWMMSIVPSGTTMNFKYMRTTEGDDKFEMAYDNQLSGDEAFSDILCMVDMAVNDHIPVIVLFSNVDFIVGFPEQLRQFIYDRFGYVVHTTDDLVDPDVDITDVGDLEFIKMNVSDYKAELSEGNQENEFFNWLTDSMAEKYRDILMSKSEDQLVKLATSKGIFVRRKASKEAIVNKILAKMEQRRSIR